MKELYIIALSYCPNIASTNRMIGLIKNYGNYNIKVKVFFLYPNKNNEKVKLKYRNIEFIYLWENIKCNNKYFVFLSALFKLFFLLKKYIPVICYSNDIYLLTILMLKNVQVYHESTENPEIIKQQNKFFDKVYLIYCRHFKGLFVISPSLKKYFVEKVHVKEEKVHIINMVVDIERFNNIEIDFIKKENIITYCGTITRYKDGVDIMIRAFAIFIKKYNTYKLKIIGPFHNIIEKDNIIQLVNELGLNNNIIFTGVVDSIKMPELLCESKLLLLSRPNNKQSKYGFPTKLGEYLMTKNPVLVTDVGDINQYLTDKENIIFAKPNNYKDFANKMIWIIDNYEQAKGIGSNGAKIAMKKFNSKIEAKKVINILFKKDK